MSTDAPVGTPGDPGPGRPRDPDGREPSSLAGDCFVGVDGGGTTTRVLVVDADGRELVRVTGPASLIDEREPRAAASVVAEVVRGALRSVAGRDPEARAAGGRPASPGAGSAREVLPPVRALHAALAGAGREPTRSTVERALRDEGLARTVRVGTDVEAAFRDAFDGEPGILLLSGTGSVAWGRSEDGREARVGGWGSRLGDEGSGWWVGLEALRAVARAVDGRGPPTGLSDAVVDHLGLDGPEELVPWAGTASKADVAGLAELVGEAAGGGDEVAEEILRRSVEALAAHVTTLVRRLGPWTVEGGPAVAMAGGLLEPRRGVLSTRVRAALEARGMEVETREPDPARGAAELARDSRGGGGARGRDDDRTAQRPR